VRKRLSVSVCLSVSYKSGVCMWLSNNVNTGTRKSIIWLVVMYGCERQCLALRIHRVYLRYLENIRSEFLTQINEKKINVGKQLLSTAHTFGWFDPSGFFLFLCSHKDHSVFSCHLK
jgi:hypothetical protein